MADNLVFTGANGITMHSSKTGVAAVDLIQWNSVAPQRLSAWKKIVYTGYDGVDAMFLGRKPVRHVLIGHINAETTAVMVTLYNKVLALGKDKVAYTTTGPIVTSSVEKVIVDDIIFDPIGTTAGFARFRINIVIIGEPS